jgi:sugar/nucleoside kinase (ribokinase family)
MPETRHDVVAIGNAIVDIIGRCDDTFLAKHALSKGSMALVDTEGMQKLYADMGPAVEISGGSAANTMVGVASFGGRAGFIGKVADDDLGRIFRHDIRAANVAYDTTPAKNSLPTARCLIVVTPDGERTMNTYLGVSPQLDHGEVDAKLIEGAAITYLEGYLFDRDAAKTAFHQAAAIARKAGRKVALTLSDGFCVDRHRGEFLGLIHAGIDILFANEREITALYETSSFDEAAKKASRDTRLAVLTRSAKGSLIVTGDKSVMVAAMPVSKVVDTTGAGDLYAAGFLYGLATGRDLETCGRLGSLAASEIISHVGARPETRLDKLARDKGIIV